MLFSDWDQSSEYKDPSSGSPTLRSSHSCHHCLRGTQLVRQQTYNGRLCNLQTSKTHYRKFKTDISRKGIARPQSQIPHSCVFPPFSVCLFCYRKICGPIQGIYKSLTDTWMWKLGLRTPNSFSRNGIFVAVHSDSLCDIYYMIIGNLLESTTVFYHNEK